MNNNKKYEVYQQPPLKQSVRIVIEETPLDFRVKECGLLPQRKLNHASRRGNITEFSIKAQQNCRFKLRSAAENMKLALCLTYPLEMRDSLDGVEIKRHLDNFFKVIRRAYGNATKYVWVLEFQNNGNPHFHVMTDILPADLSQFRNFISETWYRIVGSNLLKHKVAGTECDLIRSHSGVASYFAKYLQKSEQKQVPDNFKNVGRFWGGSRNAWNVEKVTLFCGDTGKKESEHNARREIRDLRRLRERRLKLASLKNGKKYRIYRSGGGFILWGASPVYKQMAMGLNASSYSEFEKRCIEIQTRNKQ